MLFSSTLAAGRRLAALTLLTVSVFLWMQGDSVTIASCGDYLMPLGSHGHSSPNQPSAGGHFDQLESVRVDFIASIYPWQPKCHGPGCNGAPDSRDTMTVITLPTRSPVHLALLEEETTVLPSVFKFSSFLEDDAAPSSLLASIFKPPRSCSLDGNA